MYSRSVLSKKMKKKKEFSGIVFVLLENRLRTMAIQVYHAAHAVSAECGSGSVT